MMPRLNPFILVALCVVTSACSSSKPQTAPPPALSRPSPTTCATTTPADAADSTWQLISADQFTFCIPKAWVVLGKEAKLGSAVVRWGNTDELERVAVTRGTVRVPV